MSSFLARVALRGAGLAISDNVAHGALHPETPATQGMGEGSALAADADAALDTTVPVLARASLSTAEPRAVSQPLMELPESRRIDPRREQVVPVRSQEGVEPRTSRRPDIPPHRVLDAPFVRDAPTPAAVDPRPVIVPAPTPTPGPKSGLAVAPMAPHVEDGAVVPSLAPVEEPLLRPRPSAPSPRTEDLTMSGRPATRQPPALESRVRPEPPRQQPVTERGREAAQPPERVPIHPAPDGRSVPTRGPALSAPRLADPRPPVRVHIGAIEIHAPPQPSSPAVPGAAPVADHVLPASFDDFAALRRYAAWSR